MTAKRRYKRNQIRTIKKLKEPVVFRAAKMVGMFAVFCLLIILFINVNNQKASAAVEHPQVSKTIVVQNGDTLWKIARTYKGKKDARRFIYDLEKCNNLKAPTIYPGQTLLLPAS